MVAIPFQRNQIWYKMICCFFLKRLRSIRIHTPLNWASVNLRIRWNSLLRIPPSRGPLFVVPVGPQQRPMQRRQRRLGFGKSLDPWKIGQFFSEVNYHFAWDVSWMMFLDVYWYLISLIPIPWDSFDIDVSWGFFVFGCSHKKRIQEFLSCFSIFSDAEPASSEKRMLFR